MRDEYCWSPYRALRTQDRLLIFAAATSRDPSSSLQFRFSDSTRNISLPCAATIRVKGPLFGKIRIQGSVPLAKEVLLNKYFR